MDCAILVTQCTVSVTSSWFATKHLAQFTETAKRNAYLEVP